MIKLSDVKVRVELKQSIFADGRILRGRIEKAGLGRSDGAFA